MKPSWSEVAVLGLLLFFAMIMANGWPQGDWAFGWGAVGALGSVGTGIAATVIAYKQKQIVRLERKRSALYLNRKLVKDFSRVLRSIENAVEGGMVPLVVLTNDQIDSEEYKMKMKKVFEWISKIEWFSIKDVEYARLVPEYEMTQIESLNAGILDLIDWSNDIKEGGFLITSSPKILIEKLKKVLVSSEVLELLPYDEQIRSRFNERLLEIEKRLSEGYPKSLFEVSRR